MYLDLLYQAAANWLPMIPQPLGLCNHLLWMLADPSDLLLIKRIQQKWWMSFWRWDYKRQWLPSGAPAPLWFYWLAPGPGTCSMENAHVTGSCLQTRDNEELRPQFKQPIEGESGQQPCEWAQKTWGARTLCWHLSAVTGETWTQRPSFDQSSQRPGLLTHRNCAFKSVSALILYT